MINVCSVGAQDCERALGCVWQDEDEEDTGEDSENVETFCICKRPSYGEMVACDNTSCGVRDRPAMLCSVS